MTAEKNYEYYKQKHIYVSIMIREEKSYLNLKAFISMKVFLSLDFSCPVETVCANGRSPSFAKRPQDC